MRRLMALVFFGGVIVGVASSQEAGRRPSRDFCPDVAKQLAKGDAAKQDKYLKSCIAFEDFLFGRGPIPSTFKWEYCQGASEEKKAEDALLKIMVTK